MPKRIILIISAIGFLISVIAVTGYQIALLTPASKKSQTISFEISQGTPTKTVARDLKDRGIIKSPFLFLFYVKSHSVTLRAGFYTLDSSKNVPAIADIIGKGKVSEYKITIPEGWRAEQIAQLLAKQGIVGYDDFMAAAKDNEGRLFPDTYRLGLKITPGEIVGKMEKNFERRLAEAGIDKLSNDDLILASIVEREAKRDEDRAKIAGVYKNRLAIDMALEADPGTQYAVDSESVKQLGANAVLNYDFWKPITAEQNKTFESSYNTYLHRGLPPGPIANPGIKSIQAALKPEKNSFYFFFNLSDGTTIYSKTREEHNVNRKKYGI